MQKLSIVIPCYNSRKTLTYCLKSIVEATSHLESYEILAVDNNSSDNTASIIKSYPNVTYLKETKQGRSYARNKGIDEASGSLVAFIDSDVIIDRDWIDSLMELFLQNPQLGGAQGKIQPIPMGEEEWFDRYRDAVARYSTNGSYILTDILGYETPMINSAACMYNTEALRLVGGFDVSLQRHEDIDLSKRVFYCGYMIGTTSKAISKVYFHGEGIWDYVKRSYSHGLYKIDYLMKWQRLDRQFFPEMIKDFYENAPLTIKPQSILFTGFSPSMDLYRFFTQISKMILDFIFLGKGSMALFSLLNFVFQGAGGSSRLPWAKKQEDVGGELPPLAPFINSENMYHRKIILDDHIVIFDIRDRTYHSFRNELISYLKS